MNDGGSAFPCDVFDPDVDGPEQHEGMSLRDYFAAKALGPMLAFVLKVDDPSQIPDESIAKRAYNMADAMLKARQQ